MNALMIPLGKMVGRAELEEYFRDAPDEVLGYIEMLGTKRDVRLAQHLPFRGQVMCLWEVIQRTLKA